MHPVIGLAIRLGLLHLFSADDDDASIPLSRSEAVAGIDIEGGDAFVVLKSGHRYEVSTSDALGLLNAASPGAYWNEHIRRRK